MACMALRRTDIVHAAARPSAGSAWTPSGYGPADLRSAYNVPSGANGITVAVTDAYDDPSAESDLGVYRSQFGLPACTTANGCFRKVNQNGQASPPPRADASWSSEVSLDLDMVSAICPGCHILLIEASSNSDSSLFSAINRAVTMGVKVVSNSWGGDEGSSETSLDARYLNHPGVAITASTGDDGFGTEFPAASRFVTAVGGTSLEPSSDGRGWSETAWTSGGSGCSRYEAKPSWQKTVTTNCSGRAEADVAAVADPRTGVAVYQSFGEPGWSVYGGTSAAAPIIAAMFALAGEPGATDYPASYPYSHGSGLFDVTSGGNGACGTLMCTAAAGWDGPTGLGTPNGITAFASTSTPTPTCASQNLVGNPGFEAGTAPPWSGSSEVIAPATEILPTHGGSYLGRFDGTGHLHADTLSQTVTIPSGCTSASLSYWLRVSTTETTTTTAFDTLRVTAGSTQLKTSSNLNPGEYALVNVDLETYIGDRVTITFTGTEDGSLPTTFAIDDVAVNVD
jgi:hypothetical protein